MNPEFRLGGYAGTGKTTVIKALQEALKKTYNITVAAFTGKAVSVLQKKGVYASTLHSLMYDCVPTKNGLSFVKKTSLVEDYDLIIVDESSMISCDLYRDLQSFNIKLLFVGDPGQLEPVGDNPNLMAKTDFVLTQIHRQAEASPIIGLATKVRKGGGVIWPQAEGLIIEPKAMTGEKFWAADQVICARNETRQSFNARARKFKSFDPFKIEVGDKLICLRNSIKFSVFNGTIFTVNEFEDSGNHWMVKITNDIGTSWSIPIWKEPFTRPGFKLLADTYIPKDVTVCDYAYAITCHKAQGSEWDKVLVWDETMPGDMKRWRYTAITRAAKELRYCV